MVLGKGLFESFKVEKIKIVGVYDLVIVDFVFIIYDIFRVDVFYVVIVSYKIV